MRIGDMNFLVKPSSINVHDDGTRSIGVETATTAYREETVVRRTLSRSILKNGWYRNAEGGLLFWMNAADMNKICIPMSA